MKVMITGSSGFLGKELKKILLKNKYEFCFLTRKNKKIRNHYYCPLQNHKNLGFILNKTKPDVIVNLAAEINLKKKTKNMYNVNARPLKIFSNYCIKEKKHLIQSSSILVHGDHRIYSHKTKFKPKIHYGKSKLLADRYIIKSGCLYTILRFGGIYGEKGPAHLGINNFIQNVIKGKRQEFKGNPKSKRNYIYVKDAAKIIKRCIDEKIYGVFYSGGETLTFRDMIKKINSKHQKKNIIIIKKTNKPPKDQIVLNDKIIKLTPFSKALGFIK